MQNGVGIVGDALVRKYIERQTFDDGVLVETQPAGVEHQITNGTSFEAFAQISLCAQAAQSLLNGLGPNWLVVDVIIDGHANPHHQKNEGWSNDTLSARVAVVEYIQAEDDEDDGGEEVAEATSALHVVKH